MTQIATAATKNKNDFSASPRESEINIQPVYKFESLKQLGSGAAGREVILHYERRSSANQGCGNDEIIIYGITELVVSGRGTQHN